MAQRSILLVEDDLDLAQAYREALETEGYLVKHFADGRTASNHFRLNEDSEHFDLIVTDHKMPDKSGEAVAFDIHLMNPQQKVAVLTGHAGDVNIPENFKDKVRVFEKPTSILDVVKAVLG